MPSVMRKQLPTPTEMRARARLIDGEEVFLYESAAAIANMQERFPKRLVHIMRPRIKHRTRIRAGMIRADSVTSIN